jgi:hypothetical protein
MAESMLITCPAHSAPLIPSVLVPGDLACPEPDCGTVIHITIPDNPDFPGFARFPAEPLTNMEQFAAIQHEFVRSREAAGFSRSESMAILIAVTQANIMKDNGNA